MKKEAFFSQKDTAQSLYTMQGLHYLDEGGQLDKAVASFHAALEQNQKDATALAGLALSYRGLQNFEKCLAYFDLAIDCDPRNQHIVLQRCLTQFRLGQDDIAWTDFDRVMDDILANKLAPDYVLSFFTIPDCLIKTGKFSSLATNQARKLCQVLAFLREQSVTGIALHATVMEMMLHLCENRGSQACHLLPVALNPSDISSLGIRLDAVSNVLASQRIGCCTGKTLLHFIKTLAYTVEGIAEENGPLDQHLCISIVGLLARIRSTRVLEIIRDQKMTVSDLPVDIMIDLFNFAGPEIEAQFRAGPCPSQIKSNLFIEICNLCFHGNDSQDIEAAFNRNPQLVLRLRNLVSAERVALMHQLDQSQFNLISSGNRAMAIRFVMAMAELNLLFFGARNAFYVSGKAFLSQAYVAAFGHILFVEMLLRAEAMGMVPRIPRELVCRSGAAANQTVLEIFTSNGFEIIDRPEPALGSHEWQITYYCTADDQPTIWYDFYDQAQCILQANNARPCLKLPPAWIERGQTWLSQKGVGASDHVCVFHCRESSFWTNLHNAFMNSRNADVQSYAAGLNYLLTQGSCIFRIGDPGMSPMVGLEDANFHDLTNLEKDEEWLVFYLLYRANLFIGTNSGPAGVVNLFDTPALLTNWFPLNAPALNLNGRCWIVPKLVETKSGLASLQTMHLDPLSTTNFVTDPFKLIELSPNDLLEAITEIWQRQHGSFCEQPDMPALVERLHKVWNLYHPGRVNIPHSFLRRYGSTLVP